MFELSDENNPDEIPVNVISENQINDSHDDLTQSAAENFLLWEDEVAGLGFLLLEDTGKIILTA